MRKYGIGLICFIFLFFGISFSLAYTSFFISPESANFILSSLESSSSDFTISFNPIITPSDGETHPFSIGRNPIDTFPDLCPYLSLEPDSTEDTPEELTLPSDETDDWTLTVTSPCFEGECPADYDPLINGEPLPQSLKGQTFKCNLDVYWNGGISQIRSLTKTAHADITSKMEVSAVFTGSTEQRIDPVIIIPGIMGSAYKNGVWEIDPIFHVYDNLIETLENNAYVKGVDLFPFGYDWKNSNAETAELLKEKIDEIKDICDCDKVDIVAHSMGGLVARAYAQSGAYENDIDQLVFLGTPHKGAPKDYLTWEAGEFEDDLQSRFIKSHYEKEAKKSGYDSLFDYIHGWPITSVEELLPTYNYLKSATSSQILIYPIGYPENNFLVNLNQGLATFLESDIDITNIVGNIGVSTISTIRITDEDKLPLWEHGYPKNYDGNVGDRGLNRGIGDGTVPEYSSEFNNIFDLEIASGHVNLPTDAEEEIFAEIHGGELVDAVKTSLALKILFAKIFSPADFVIIAPDGKKVGKNFATSQEINEIPGAFYSGFSTDDEYVTIPDPSDGKYIIQLQGTGSGGSYSFETSYISDGVSATTEVFGVTAPNQITGLEVKVDNENPENLSTGRVITLDILIGDINGAYSLSWIKDKKTRDGLIAQAKLIIKFEIKRNGKLEKKVDKIIIKLIEKELDLLLKKGKITVQARDLLKEDLKYIINNN